MAVSASQGCWLYSAYLLEFEEVATFTWIWVSGLLFFIVNVYILLDLIGCDQRCVADESKL